MSKILHISTAYFASKVYKKLVEKLYNIGFDQLIYVPIRNSLHYDKNKVENIDSIKYIYSLVLKPYMKLFYFLKVRYVFQDICNKVDFSNVNIIHTHFLFTDGGVAYFLKRRFNINYITTIRNTDINLYFKYFWLARGFGFKIIGNSNALVFLSPSYENYFFKKIVPKKYFHEFKTKSFVIPNGIDDFWHNHRGIVKILSGSPLRFLFIGELTKNKNIHKTISLIKRFKKKMPCNLTIIGKDGHYKNKILHLVQSNSNFVSYHENINDKLELLEYYRSADIFIMPSKTETFGLVYAEAMSQGLPCLYSHGQGIDGFFEDGHIGYPINADDQNASIDKIFKIVNNYEEISHNCIVASSLFNWDTISDKFAQLYAVIQNKSKQ